MPRIARVVAVGYPHHITQRGNYGQDIFTNDAEREKYLSLIHDESKRYELVILAYCLMKNHVHFIVVPAKEDTMGKVFKYVNMKYSQYFNKKRKVTGHLFQGRFFSSVMDESHTLACSRYLERNPVRASIVTKPWHWKWSSARIHCGLEKSDKMNVNQLFNYIEEEQKTWKEFIAEKDDLHELKNIREQTIKGRPLADISFVKKLEKKLRRLLIPKPRGRPKKHDSNGK